MNIAIANRVRVVQPGRPQGPQLRVLPIIGPSSDRPSYRLLDSDTLPLVRVTEVSDAGSVPELMVENKLDVRVFLMDGQELVGAKQNRILNTDVVVPAASTLKIPVSCVEQGRWPTSNEKRAAGWEHAPGVAAQRPVEKPMNLQYQERPRRPQCCRRPAAASGHPGTRCRLVQGDPAAGGLAVPRTRSRIGNLISQGRAGTYRI